jgi:hypothetical protein
MFHDNSTTNIRKSHHKSQQFPPITGFTHNYTPNDFIAADDDAMQLVNDGFVRLFSMIRNNPQCEMRNNTCKIFGEIPKPSK